MVQENSAKVAPWHLVDGAIMGPKLDPEAAMRHLQELNAVAEVLWNPATPHALGMTFLTRDNQVAALDGDNLNYRAGMTLGDLGRELSQRLHAVVTIARESWDNVPADAVWPNTKPDAPVLSRTVEVTPMSAASVPFCAAVEGIDMGCVELDDGHRAVLYEAPAKIFGEHDLICETPGLALSASREDLRLVAVYDDEEQTLTHSFSMKAKIVPGAVTLSENNFEALRRDMGRGQIAGRLMELVPDANQAELAAGLRERGSQGLRRVLRALGLPRDVEAFLLEHRPIEDVDGVNLHEARGLSNAIGRSVDIMLAQPGSTGGALWSTYHKVAVEKPWIARVFASVEAATGATLVTLALKSKSPRPGLTKFGGIIGAIMVVDAIAEVSLARYLAKRAERDDHELEN